VTVAAMQMLETTVFEMHVFAMGVLAMDNAGFVLGSYALSAAVILALVAATLRRARRLSPLVRDEDKPWT
jgi:heme exporter protein D